MAKTTESPRDLDDVSITDRLAETRQELFNLRFQSATGQLDNVTGISKARREIARLLTEQRAREITEAEAQNEETR